MTDYYQLDWTYAYGRPSATATMRQSPEDFFVDEVLGFEPDGEGQHVMLHIEKRNTNTDWLAKQLARLAGVKPGAVSYAGQKDRNAVTRQWFSVDLAGKAEPDWRELDAQELTVLSAQRHGRKLRRGALRGNRFVINLHNVAGDRDELERRLELIRLGGVPNYFGEQRFGRNHDNHLQALKLFRGEIRVKDRHRRGLYLSAARSYLFNRVLSGRIEQGNWNRMLDGEVFMLEGKSAVFWGEAVTDELARRLSDGEIALTGPMWGRGDSHTAGTVRAIEEEALRDCGALREGLERAGMKMERRALRLKAQELDWQWTDTRTLRVEFFLSAGSFATSLLRELAVTA